jgi:flavin-dependent dehydrogenase
VVILEKRSPSHRKVCGDLLGPRTLWLLKELKIGTEKKGWGGSPIRAIQIFDDKKRISWAPFGGPDQGEPPAETLRRERFDRALREEAAEAGCRILYRVCFRSVIERQGDTLLCRATEGADDRCFRSRILLGADGAASAVAGDSALRVMHLRKRVLAARAYFRNVEGLRDSIELYFTPEFFPGYAWVIPVGSHVANVGLGLRADVCVRKGIRPLAAVERFCREHPVLSRRMRRAEPEGAVQGWTIGTYHRNVKRTASHILLLGDAGHFPDPLSGEGIYGALKSASLAVPWVCRAFERGDFSGSFLSGFDREAERHFRPAYRYGGWLASLPSDHPVLEPLVRWGLNRVGKNALLNPGYARRVGGFFSGMIPGKRMWNAGWFWRTFLG